MGKIIRFPIRILTEKATEDQSGLAKQLRSNVRPINLATTEDIVSESGIYHSLSGVINLSTSGENLGTGLPIFNDISGNNVISYNSLSGMGVLNVTSTSQNVIINTSQPGIPHECAFISVSQRTLNGGINQEASKVGYNDFDENGMMVVFNNPQFGDAIGKILIKCSEGFNDSTQFSIGTTSNPEYYVKKFDAPTSPSDDKLIEIFYGVGMIDKVDYIKE